MERWRECKLLQYFLAWTLEGMSGCVRRMRMPHVRRFHKSPDIPRTNSQSLAIPASEVSTNLARGGKPGIRRSSARQRLVQDASGIYVRSSVPQASILFGFSAATTPQPVM